MRAPLVMVVDDNLDAREMYAMYLEHLGFRCTQAADGAEAIALVRATPPDIILMDASMPLMDGWEAAQVLKADPVASGIPLLMLTAHAYPEHRERATQVGADGFLPKPVLPDQLAREINRVLRRRS